MPASDDPLKHLRHAFLSGDQQALEALVAEYRPRVRAFLLSQGARPEEVEDIYQVALMAVFLNLQKPGFQLTGQFSTYLLGICKNHWLKVYRKKNRQREVRIDQLTVFNLEAEWEDALEKAEWRMFVYRHVDRLGDPCRKLLRLFYWAEQKIPEIRAAMGYRTDNATSQKKLKCQKRLGRQMKKDPLFQELFGDRWDPKPPTS